jgi:hypothetical protein
LFAIRLPSAFYNAARGHRPPQTVNNVTPVLQTPPGTQNTATSTRESSEIIEEMAAAIEADAEDSSRRSEQNGIVSQRQWRYQWHCQWPEHEL